MITTRGLGHTRILRDERVVSQAVSFLKGEPVVAESWAASCARQGCANAPAENGFCESCGLEAALYFRDGRSSLWAA